MIAYSRRKWYQTAIVISASLTLVLLFGIFMLFLHLFIVSAAEIDEVGVYMAKLEDAVNIPREFEKYNTRVVEVKRDYSKIRLNIYVYVQGFRGVPPALEEYVSKHGLGYSRNLSVYELSYDENRSVETEVFSKTYVF